MTTPPPLTRKPTSWQVWLPLALFCFIQIGTTADNAILLNATSALIQSFQATVTQVQIADAMFPLCASLLMIIGSFIGLLLGWKRILQLGLLILVLGELLAVLSTNIQIFTYAARILAGIGASLATPAVLGLVPNLYHGRLRAIAFSAIGASNGLAAAIGPVAGGFTIISFGWRVGFIALAVLFAIALCGSMIIQSVPRPQKRPHFDIVGALLLLIITASLFIGLLMMNEWGLITPRRAPFCIFGFPPPLFLIALGVLTFIVFVYWQKHLEARGINTLLPSILIKNLQVRAGLYLILLVFMIMGSFSFLIITYLQVVVSMNALHTGIALSAYAMSLAIFSMLTPLVFKHLSPRILCRLGIIMIIASCFMIADELHLITASLTLFLGLFVAGAGSGLIVSQASIAITHAIKQSDAEQSGGIQGTMRNLGLAIGVSISGVILIAALTTSAKTMTNALPSLSTPVKNHIDLIKDVPFLSNQQVATILTQQGFPEQTRNILIHVNADARLYAARLTLLVMAILFFLFLFPTRHLPSSSLMEDDETT